MTFKNFKIRKRDWIIALVVVIFIVCVILLLHNRETIGQSIFGGTGNEEAQSNGSFEFDSGSKQVSTSVGNGLAVASSTGLQLLDRNGQEILKESFSMTTPAITACDTAVACFDVGGTSLYWGNLKGEFVDLTQEQNIFTVTMNDSGWMCVCTEETGYRGAVTVYNAKREQVYRWSSGEGYPITACLSPDNSLLATLSVNSEGSTVHFFRLDSETEQAQYFAQTEIIMDMCWMSDSRLCFLSQQRCGTLDENGELCGAYDFGDQYLTEYDLSGGYPVLMLGQYRTGGTGTLLSLGQNAEVVGQTEIDRELLVLDGSASYIGVLCQDGLYEYSRSMNQLGFSSDVSSAKDIAVLDNGNIFVIETNYAELYSFGG
jgi:hypothetical protein